MSIKTGKCHKMAPFSSQVVLRRVTKYFSQKTFHPNPFPRTLDGTAVDSFAKEGDVLSSVGINLVQDISRTLIEFKMCSSLAQLG